MKRLLCLLPLLLAAAGCASTSGTHTRTGPVYPARSPDCEVRVFLKGEPVPGRFVVVGLVEARGTEGVGALIPELVKQACALGADGLLELQSSTGSESTTIGMVSHGQGQISGSSYAVYAATATAVVVASPPTTPGAAGDMVPAPATQPPAGGP